MDYNCGMEEFYIRTAALVGLRGVEKLKLSHVAVFGLGGVGSYIAEALARCGVGELTLIDADCVAPSNINRQLVALSSTVGEPKTEVMAARIADINPSCRVHIRTEFFDENTVKNYDFSVYSYVADAIDSIKSKIFLICSARAANIPVISCMGAGNQMNAASFRVADVEKTRVCPLAKIVRRELKKAGVAGVKAVYSEELPKVPDCSFARAGEKFIGSVSFVPSVAGLLAAGEIVRDILGEI